MATRRPKGSYNRPTPDWFSNKAAYGSVDFLNNHQAAAYETFSLLNNATDGSLLWVTFFAMETSFSASVHFYFSQSPPGTFQFNGRMIRAGQPQIPGAFYYSNEAAPFSGTLQASFPLFVSLGSTFPQPMFIIDPSWALVMQGNSNQDVDNVMTIHYVAVNGD